MKYDEDITINSKQGKYLKVTPYGLTYQWEKMKTISDYIWSHTKTYIKCYKNAQSSAISIFQQQQIFHMSFILHFINKKI